MFGASAAAMLVPPGHAPSYMAIDMLAGALILTRPAGLPQRAIGLLFAFMVTFDLGFIVADNPDQVTTYITANVFMGWVQWAILLAWGAIDGLQYLDRRYGPHRHTLAPQGRD